MTVPNGMADTATFDSSKRKNVSLSANTQVDGIVFNAGASAFTITLPATSLMELYIRAAWALRTIQGSHSTSSRMVMDLARLES